MIFAKNHSHSQNYHLFTGSKGPLHYWHWVELDSIKFALASRRIKDGSIDIAEYGKIVKSGWGENPPRLEELLAN